LEVTYFRVLNNYACSDCEYRL